MSVEKDVGLAREDHNNGSRDISVDEAHESNVRETAHELDEKKESINISYTILAAGFGLVSDGYQESLMTMANVIFAILYPTEYTSTVSTQVSTALLVGAVIGQVSVGLICDRIGRKAALVVTTLFIVLGATLSTAAHGANGSPLGLFWFLTIARGIVGVGVGGEYPASTTSASEAANETSIQARGPVVIMVTNFVLAFGGPVALSVFLIILCAAGEEHLEAVWRFSFGFGILLPLTVLYFRMRMLSSKLYRKSAIKRDVPYWLVLKRYWRSLIGTCGTWFLYDFVTFPNYIFSGAIIASVVPGGSLLKTAEWQLLLQTIPLIGVVIGAWLCNRIGRKYSMMLGFAGYIVIGLAIGLAYDKITSIVPLFVVMYALLATVGNLGPGDMTIVTSSESYATPVRGTCYGLSAAFGKTGGAIGTQVFTPIQIHFGKHWTFIVAAICGAIGVVLTYFFVPDMTGINLADEDAKFMRYLRENGWEGEVGEDDDKGLITGSSASIEAVSEEKA